ncbi:hypothetical protein HPP92_005441 [Vanilla planifolia]|uniref:Prolamin-like domain-containing protein n=1 Tax=Vanilla planifolia TaxID=51239 RepID=A0A835RZJ8_VANPL|nr:hypothetical protein HPP92_005441 [Vanilla planifolia]
MALVFAALCLVSFSGARQVHPGTAATSAASAATLASRIAAADRVGGGSIADCWSALLELRSCTGEIVLFFLNGETYLTLDCCRSIGVITHHCWPSMLTSLGFTAEEGDILRGFCDADGEPTDAPLSPSSGPSA